MKKYAFPFILLTLVGTYLLACTSNPSRRPSSLCQEGPQELHKSSQNKRQVLCP